MHYGWLIKEQARIFNIKHANIGVENAIFLLYNYNKIIYFLIFNSNSKKNLLALLEMFKTWFHKSYCFDKWKPNAHLVFTARLSRSYC